MAPTLVRLCTAGSVDDGKSTLIGRLLLDSRLLFDDQIDAVATASRRRAGTDGQLDLSLFTDGLRAEREQGITIDVAYRYFATPARQFILADTPGHEQYTRNMATGASTADVAILLLDAEKGIRPQSLVHARIARLLGVSSFVLAVNKIDRVGFDERVFRGLVDEFRATASGAPFQAIPVSALHGDNVVTSSARTPWYKGPSLLAHLNEVDVTPSVDSRLRMPIQLVLRGANGVRALAGRVVSGSIRVGDPIAIWPFNTSSTVARIVTMDGDLKEARAPRSVALILAGEVDAGRGDLVTDSPPSLARSFDATVVWMDERPLTPGRRYLMKHAARTMPVRVDRALALNQIERVGVAAAEPFACDTYSENRATGSFILIDPDTNFTSGAGMIEAVRQ